MVFDCVTCLTTPYQSFLPYTSLNFAGLTAYIDIDNQSNFWGSIAV